MHTKNNIRSACLFLCVVLFATPLYGLAAMVPDPTEQMKPFIAKMTKILSEADLKNDADCNICQRLIDISRERFDYNEMSKRVLGKAWRKLSTEEKADFVDLFTELLEYAYVGKIQSYSGQSIVFKDQRIKGKRAEVKTELIDKNKAIPVSYIMLLEGDKWMVYDVVVEGVSLIRNYMEQFREILRKDQYSGLIKQIEKKVRQLQDERAERIVEQQQ